MLRNFLIVALRTVRRHPMYAAMNVAGLAIGIAACTLIMLYVQDELSYDRMHDAAERIYRVVEARTKTDGGTEDFAYTMGPLGPALAASVPVVEKSVRGLSRFSVGRTLVQRGDTRFYIGDQLFAEEGFFDLFDFEFVSGAREGALDAPLEVVLTENAARQYFGAEEPVGQTLDIGGVGDFTVTGVVRLTSNTHVDYSIFLSFATLLTFDGLRGLLQDDWSSNGVITYLRLAPGTSPTEVENAMRTMVARHAGDEISSTRSLSLQSVRSIHLGSSHIEFDEHTSGGRPVYLYLFSIVAVIVVLIAAMNYMNMATARSLRRAREIGMRKVVGAIRRQLVGQFLAESLLTTSLALVGALLLARLLLPTFNGFTGKDLALSLTGPVVLGALALVLAVGLLAGAYPALYLSRFRPADVLRGGKVRERGSVGVRRGLVITQFAMSIGLILATLVVHDQLEYVQSKELGFEEEQLAVIDINSGDVRSQFETVRREFASVPGVSAVSVSNNVPGDWKNITQVEAGRRGAGLDALQSAYFLGIDEQFLETYEIRVLEGRGFTGATADSTSALLNRTAASNLGVTVGDRIDVPDGDYTATVIGIVEDFHVRSLHEEIAPVVIGYALNPIDVIDYFTVRLETSDPSAAVAGLREIGNRFDPQNPFELNFLDERLNDFYTGEQRVRQIFGAAALLGIFVACMGLFGLAAFTAEQRTKEIGIRKALGATTAGIAALLTKDYAKLIVIAFAIATPVSYLAMRWWLQDFAYRTTIGLDTVLFAGIAAFLLAVVTVSYQAVRAACANPVRSLRYE